MHVFARADAQQEDDDDEKGIARIPKKRKGAVLTPRMLDDSVTEIRKADKTPCSCMSTNCTWHCKLHESYPCRPGHPITADLDGLHQVRSTRDGGFSLAVNAPLSARESLVHSVSSASMYGVGTYTKLEVPVRWAVDARFPSCSFACFCCLSDLAVIALHGRSNPFGCRRAGTAKGTTHLTATLHMEELVQTHQLAKHHSCGANTNIWPLPNAIYAPHSANPLMVDSLLWHDRIWYHRRIP